jgi:hypothetical protein
MKTIDNAAIRAGKNVDKNWSGQFDKTIKYADRETPFVVVLPSVEYVREWNDQALGKLIELAGNQWLHHGGSEAVRRAIDSETAVDKDGKPKPVIPIVGKVWLADVCTEVKISKRIVERATAMLDQIEKGGDGLWQKFIKQAGVYGHKLTGEWDEVTLDDCIAYQQAKEAYTADLL